ncbi:MAG: (Fe-S)-binding protein [Deltaproteobacteria bacterium]|nr:(Fe-S)-binding protein [Deltaproteobacteria bacterium]
MSTPSCNKCGTCMSVCPVYQVTGMEAYSPRGKLSLIEANREGRLPFSDRFAELLSYCLLCGACSNACPAGVNADASIQEARARLVEEKGLPAGKRCFFHYLLDSEHLLPFILKGGSLIQSLLCKRIPEDSGLHCRFPISLLAGRSWLPSLASPFFLENDLPEETSAPARAAYFAGCVTNYLFPNVGKAILNIFDFLGEPIYVPNKQKCCGFPAFAAGDKETARSLARANISAFMDGRVDYIITACASCSSHLRFNYPKLLADDPVFAEKAAEFSAKVIDISAFLFHKKCFSRQLSALTSKKNSLKVTYHDPCHFRFREKIFQEPRLLIKSLPGVDFCEPAGGAACCGHGGLFSITHYDISQRILDRRMAALKEVGADILVTSCMGCLLQWKEGLSRHGINARAVHLVELFDIFLSK